MTANVSPLPRRAPAPLRAAHADPRVLVTRLRFEVVAEAAVAERDYDFVAFGGDYFFRCPSCHHRDHNLPPATLVDDLRWRCTRCMHVGTRYELERLVLEDAHALDRMLAIVAERDTP